MEDGFLLIDKEADWTSRDVCNKIQGLFHTKRVGHIGTLDPFATGLLIVSVNKATKAGQFLESEDKTYLATLVLGEARDGGDITGEVIDKKDIPNLTKDYIDEILNSFLGEIEQVPPLKSAVHFQGRKLYEYAYEGQVVTPPARKVKINSIELVSFSKKEIIFRTNVSKGTYIRVLGEDIAKKIGTVGYLSALRREKIASIDLTNTKKLSDVTVNDLVPISSILVNMPHVMVDDVIADKAKRGLTIIFKEYRDYANILLVDQNDNAIAVYERVDRGLFKSARGLF